MNKESVYVFIFDGFSDWEIAYLTPELNKSEKTNLNYFSIDGSPVKSGGGLTILPHCSIKQIDSNNVSLLVLPGGSAWEDGSMNEIGRLVDELNIANKTIAAICGATLLLARKGYLDNVKHTSNALDYVRNFTADYRGADKYLNELAVTDKNLITANGIAPVEFAREIFRNVQLFDEKAIEKWFQLFKNGIWKDTND
jgi:putative intracellular protease/amidase